MAIASKTARTALVLGFIGLSLGAVAAPVNLPDKPQASAAFTHEHSPAHGAESVAVTANEAARRAQAINGGGKVLSVDAMQEGWRVKLLKDGNVRVVQLPH
jgi:hypothetical protein